MIKLKQLSGSQILAILGILVLASPVVVSSLYQNYIIASGILLLFIAWVRANFENQQNLIHQNRWETQKKAMLAMTACIGLALTMLVYYEIQMPKYKVAITNKELYKVPPQLSKKQLIKLGSECNTYGNTLCSHAVFAKIVKLDPRNYIALGNLAMAQSHLGFHEYAIENFSTAIKNGARTYDIFKFYGNSLKALDMKEQAVQAYKASLRLNPNQDYLKKRIENLDLEG